MSSGVRIEIGAGREGDLDGGGFNVRRIDGCRIIYGSVPMSEFAMLTHGFSKKALMDVDLADRIGASFVIGEPKDLQALRARGLSPSAKRQGEAQEAAQNGVDDAVVAWLADGARGLSSNAMCKQFFGVPRSAGRDHPHDPDDLSRCLAFLDATQSHERVSSMAGVSPQWAGLVAAWSEITASFLQERGEKSAPKTYALMRKAIDRAAVKV